MKLINWEALEEMQKMEDNSVDLIVTDPPYKTITWWSKWYENKYKWSVIKSWVWKIFKHQDVYIKNYINDLFRILKNGSHCYIMTNNLNLEEFLTESRKAWFKLHNILIWEKWNKTANRWYMKSFEFIIFLYKWKAKYINNKWDDNILRHKNKFRKYYKEELWFEKHPTEKPVSLLEQLVWNSSNKWDIVFDPFMWNWSCWVACQNLNRDFIWIELDENYFKIAEQRILTPNK